MKSLFFAFRSTHDSFTYFIHFNLVTEYIASLNKINNYWFPLHYVLCSIVQHFVRKIFKKLQVSRVRELYPYILMFVSGLLQEKILSNNMSLEELAQVLKVHIKSFH